MFRQAVCLALVSLLFACGPSSPGGRSDGGGGPSDDGGGDCGPLDTIDNCGACGNACGWQNASGTSCVAGTCVPNCNPGFAECDTNPANGCEADLTSDTHCGTCYNACGGNNATGTCVAGVCDVTCISGFGDCNNDFADGCESDLMSDVMRCGSCERGCTTTCVAGQCTGCDSGLALDSTDPLDAARAMGMCGAEVVSASWVMPDGSAVPAGTPNFDLGHGILSGFGSVISPREGVKVFAISSGTARQPTDPGYQDVGGFDKGYVAAHPMGFPKESPACPGVTTGEPHDAIALQVTLQAPDWAQGMGFDFDFYTYEWPGFVCSEFNDFFVALMTPIPMGLPDPNISFDAAGNPISVNAAFMSVCGCTGGPPCFAGGKTFDCPNGTAELVGTGFEGFGFGDWHGATSWLTTTAPVMPGAQFTLIFGIYDSGDGVLDSTTVIDNFHWTPNPPPVVTDPIE